MEPLLVYYSSESLNTHRFVTRLNFGSYRIPLSPKEPQLKIDKPYVLFCPTYAGWDGQGAVPKQVISFLNDLQNRKLLKGIIASGNRNFGQYYAHAGKVISMKCDVPILYRYELSGTEEDVRKVKIGLEQLWQS